MGEAKNLFSLTVLSILVSPNLLAAFAAAPETGTAGGGGQGMDPAPWTEYHRYDDVTEFLENLTSRHRDIAVMRSLGRTFEGREIWAVKVSDNPQLHEDEPEVLFIGGHHAREWSGYEVVLYYLEYLLDNYVPGGKGVDDDGDKKVNEDPFDGADNDGDGAVDEDEDEARVTWLIDSRQIWFVPLLNPDGTEYAYKQVDAGEKDESKLWRKNREPNVNPVTGQPYPEKVGSKNMWGTDLNRNYGWHWGELGYQGYADPSREDYIGPADRHDDDGDGLVAEDPMDGIDNDRDGRMDEDGRGGLSTRETRALRTLFSEHRFVSFISYHSYKVDGEIYWPWMYTRQLPEDEELYTSLAAGMSLFNGYHYRNYTGTGDNTRKGPLVDGDLNDYGYGAFGILSYCIELKQDGFVLPAEKLPEKLLENLGANLYLTGAVGNLRGVDVKINHTPLGDTTSTLGYRVTASVGAGNGTGAELVAHGLSVFYSPDGREYRTVEMHGDGAGRYLAVIPGFATGTKVRYYISATTVSNTTANLPQYAPVRVFSFTVLKYRGAVSPLLMGLHIIFIVGALVFIGAALVLALLYMRRGTGYNRLLMASGITAGMVFIGGFPLGWAVAYQRFGVAWTGIPFGWDITDNKTLVILLYWAAALFLVRGSIFALFRAGRGKWCPHRFLLSLSNRHLGVPDLNKERRDTISRARFARIAVFGALLSLALYLVPHSIAVSPAFTVLLFVLLVLPFVPVPAPPTRVAL